MRRDVWYMKAYVVLKHFFYEVDGIKERVKFWTQVNTKANWHKKSWTFILLYDRNCYTKGGYKKYKKKHKRLLPEKKTSSVTSKLEYQVSSVTNLATLDHNTNQGFLIDGRMTISTPVG